MMPDQGTIGKKVKTKDHSGSLNQPVPRKTRKSKSQHAPVQFPLMKKTSVPNES